MNWLKKIWHDPVWSKVIAVGVIAVIAAGITTAKGAWQSVWAEIIGAFLWLGETSAIYNWLWLLWAIVTLIVMGMIAIAFVQNRTMETVSFKEYNEEVFFDVQWRWQYADTMIVNLTSFCSNCDYQVFADSGLPYGASQPTVFQCEDCEYSPKPIDCSASELESRVKRSIHKRLRNGTWRNVVDQKFAEEGR